MSEANEHIYGAPQGPVHYWAHPVDDAVDANSPWLVFLHGLSADHTLFDPQAAYFKSRYPRRLPHAAHNSNFDNPAFVNNQIERFVENIRYDEGA